MPRRYGRWVRVSVRPEGGGSSGGWASETYEHSHYETLRSLFPVSAAEEAAFGSTSYSSTWRGTADASTTIKDGDRIATLNGDNPDALDRVFHVQKVNPRGARIVELLLTEEGAMQPTDQ